MCRAELLHSDVIPYDPIPTPPQVALAAGATPRPPRAGSEAQEGAARSRQRGQGEGRQQARAVARSRAGCRADSRDELDAHAERLHGQGTARLRESQCMRHMCNSSCKHAVEDWGLHLTRIIEGVQSFKET